MEYEDMNGYKCTQTEAINMTIGSQKKLIKMYMYVCTLYVCFMYVCMYVRLMYVRLMYT